MCVRLVATGVRARWALGDVVVTVLGWRDRHWRKLAGRRPPALAASRLIELNAFESEESCADAQAATCHASVHSFAFALPSLGVRQVTWGQWLTAALFLCALVVFLLDALCLLVTRSHLPGIEPLIAMATSGLGVAGRGPR